MFTSRSHSKLLGTTAAALLLLGSVSSVHAAGTASGTTISNQASVDYQVATISQPTVNSNNYQFVVDTKIDLTVTTIDGTAIPVAPGSNDNVLTFTVKNTGNATQDFQVSAAALVGGTGKFLGTDNIDADNVQVFVETNGTPGYQAGVGNDTATHINALAPSDPAVTVYIVSDFNTGYSDGDIASYYLVAEARVNDGAPTLGVPVSESATDNIDPTVVDIVFADGDGDGGLGNDASRDAKHSSQDDYEISAAGLTITKSSTVVSDPFNNTTNPKRIPGAVVEYVLTVTNAASSATATDIAISDSLNTEITAVPSRLAFNTQYDATAGQGIVVGHPDFSVGADTEYTNANDGVVNGISVDWNLTGANTVTVTGITLDAGESATVKFRVTIQ